MYVFICQNTHDKTIKADSVAWLPGRQSELTKATDYLLVSMSNSITSIDFRNLLKLLKSTVCDGKRFQMFITRSQKYVDLIEELLKSLNSL